MNKACSRRTKQRDNKREKPNKKDKASFAQAKNQPVITKTGGRIVDAMSKLSSPLVRHLSSPQ